MQLLKRITILILLSTSLTRTTRADKLSDCLDAVQAAKADIAAHVKLEQDQQATITDLQKSLNDTRSQLASADKSLDSWYHDPVIMTLLGIVVGGAGAAYLVHK